MTDDRRSWDEVRATVPERFDPTLGQLVDLVLAVELGGPVDAAGRRLAMARRVLDHLAATHAVPGVLHAGLVGYQDHRFGASGRAPDPDVLREHPLGSPGDARRALDGWVPDGRGEDDYGAPLEDALQAVAELPWRPTSIRVVVVLAARPPHPKGQQADLALPCPHKLDWEAHHYAARQGHKVRFVLVGDPPALPDPNVGESLRQRLGRARELLGDEQRLFDLDGADPARIAAAADIARPTGGGQLLLPLDPASAPHVLPTEVTS